MLFKLSNLNSNLALTLGYLNLPVALNNSAQDIIRIALFHTHMVFYKVWLSTWANPQGSQGYIPMVSSWLLSCSNGLIPKLKYVPLFFPEVLYCVTSVTSFDNRATFILYRLSYDKGRPSLGDTLSLVRSVREKNDDFKASIQLMWLT